MKEQDVPILLLKSEISLLIYKVVYIHFLGFASLTLKTNQPPY